MNQDELNNNVFLHYNCVYQKYQDTKDQIIKNILCEHLVSQYEKICKIQSEFIKLLDLKNPDNVTLAKIHRYFQVIGEIGHSVMYYYENTLKNILNDLQDIHNKHNAMFTKTQDQITQDEEVYDNTFITMSNSDITEHNAKVKERVTQSKNAFDYLNHSIHIGCYEAKTQLKFARN